MTDELKTIGQELRAADLVKNGSPKQVERPGLVKDQESGPMDRVAAASESIRLFSEAEMGEFRSEWIKIQTRFVDEPRGTVKDADELVAALMQRLAEGFANERSGLEKQWDRGDNASTEDLRVALQRYRTFFDRLLNL